MAARMTLIDDHGLHHDIGIKYPSIGALLKLEEGTPEAMGRFIRELILVEDDLVILDDVSLGRLEGIITQALEELGKAGPFGGP